MTKIPKRLTPVHTLPHRQLQIMFYQGYDEAYLNNKALALAFALEEPERFCEHFDGRPGAEDLNTDEAFNSLRADAYFSLLQGCESLFALLLSVFQDKPDWVYLSQYAPGDIAIKAELFLAGKFGDLTDGEATTKRQFVTGALYTGFASVDPDQLTRWDENLDNAAWLLERMARKYVDGIEEYNAFKHGMRVALGPGGIKFTPVNVSGEQTGHAFQSSSSDTITFLDWSEVSGNKAQLYKVTKAFNPQEATFYLSVMHRMFETIKKTRLARLEGASGVKLNTFFNLDRAFIVGLSQSMKVRLPL